MFFENEHMNRLGAGFTGALCLHCAVFFLISSTFIQAVIPSQTYSSAPTNISIRFTTPPKPEKKIVKAAEILPTPPVQKTQPPEPKPVKQKPKVKKVVKKQVTTPPPEKLNKIEPASITKEEKVTEQPIKETVQTSKVTPDIIPVTREVKTTGRRAQPEYPRSAQRRGQEGVVLIRVLISENGTREDIQIHKPSRYALLNTAAMKAVKKWKFDPHMVNGSARKSWVEIPIEFKLQ